MTRTLKILIILIVLNLCGLGGLWFGYTIIQGKKDEQVQLNKERTEAVQNVRKIMDLRRTLALVEDDQKKLNKYFYNTSDESRIKFMTQMELMGTTTAEVKVETRSIKISHEPLSLRGDFVLTGSWENIYYYLRLIEEFPARIAINHFDLRLMSINEKTSAEEWSGLLSIDLMSIK